MNEAEIRKYASLMRELDLTGIEIDEKNGVIRLEREKDSAESGSFFSGAGAVSESGMASGAQGYAGAPAAAGSMAAPENGSPAVSAAAAGEHPGMGILDSVNADPFVKVGDVVHKGSVLCIIEAMKLMNEVVAEKDGVIEAVCAENGQVVEYGTELFRIKELSA